MSRHEPPALASRDRYSSFGIALIYSYESVTAAPLRLAVSYLPDTIDMAPSNRVAAQRIGSLLFCPACGTLLDLPKDDQDEIPCDHCGRTEPASCESVPLRVSASKTRRDVGSVVHH